MNNGRLFVAGREYLTRSTTSTNIILKSAETHRAVFISHQRNDADTAKRLAIAISTEGRPCYLDTLDPNVDEDSPELESYLRGVIGSCQALLAVVSNYTERSWWVPLEIGVALDRNKHIGTYWKTPATLPSYLWQWPIMDNIKQAVAWSKVTNRNESASTHRRWRARWSNQEFYNAI